MKFTNGYWLDRENFQILRAKEIRGIKVDQDTQKVTVFAPTRFIGRRGDTLNTGEFTISIAAVAEGVIKVGIERFRGSPNRNPQFSVSVPADYQGVLETTDDAYLLSAGDLAVRIPRSGPWQLGFTSKGEPLTSMDDKSVAHAKEQGGDSFSLAQLTLAPGERIYGMGERFGPFAKNGQSIDIWNEDGGTASEQSYKNIPFYLSTAGYGLFVADSGDVSFEIGSEAVSRAQFSAPGETLEFYVIDGPTPKDVLARYTQLTGRPPQVPTWSYGTWLSTSFTTDYDENTVNSFVDGMIERDLPLSVFHFDCFWMREFHWCDFIWDPETFPDPEGMLQRLKAKGLRISMWINPYIGQRSHLWDEAAALGYLVKRVDGTIWQTDLWQSGMALVDFTNPAACTWYAEQLGRLLDMGVDCFKTDFGERIPVADIAWHGQQGPRGMHNYYTHLYNQIVFDLLKERRGEGEAVLFARSATAGTQQFPVHWGGDCASTYIAMGESLRGGLSLAMSGFGYWSHDIGGFEGLPDAGVFKRWTAFGMLSSHSRFHGSSSYRVPWAFDEEAVAVTRQFSQLKMQLMPYLGAAAQQVTAAGTPIMRPMVLEFAEDPATYDIDTQYMLGSALLVSPVFREDGVARTYLPAGTWTHLLDRRQLTGGRWISDQYDFSSLGLFVRDNTVLPWGARNDRPDYHWADQVTLRLFALAEGFTETIRVGEVSFTVSRHGESVTIETDSDFPWAVDDQGHRVEFPAGTNTGTVTLVNPTMGGGQ